MVIEGRGLHHAHQRKRIHLKHEISPHPDRWIHFMDRAIYVVGVIGPLMSIPQIVKIWGEQNAAGVSLVSWLAFLIHSLFWLGYGILHREKPIIVAYCLWVTFNFLIVLG